jgi:hypothetical protein
MRLALLHAVLGILAAACIGHTWAKEPAGPCDGGFPGASAAYAQSYQRDDRLAATRGFSFRSVGMAALDDILGSGRTGTAVALFSEEGNRHCVYILADHEIRAFGVTPSGDVPARATIAALLDAWRSSAGISDSPSRGLRATLLTGQKPLPRARPAAPLARAAAGEQLAATLFPEGTRKALAGFERLVILPYAGVGAIPYAALPLDPDGSLFVDRLAVSISPGPRYFGAEQPSAQFGGSTRACSRTGLRLPAVVLGDPVVPASNGLVFPALPGARREAIEVAQRFGVTPVLGADAVREAVLASGGFATIIHIAAHGVANAKSPLESYIALSDGPWTAGEIQRTCLAGTRIAILSACQSGLGASHDGGIIGLGRAFIIAGSASVAMSLWSVDDTGTEVLMRHFTEAIEKTPNHPDAALRTAMLKTRQTNPQPFVWAAFAILGGSGRAR